MLLEDLFKLKFLFGKFSSFTSEINAEFVAQHRYDTTGVASNSKHLS